MVLWSWLHLSHSLIRSCRYFNILLRWLCCFRTSLVQSRLLHAHLFRTSSGYLGNFALADPCLRGLLVFWIKDEKLLCLTQLVGLLDASSDCRCVRLNFRKLLLLVGVLIHRLWSDRSEPLDGLRLGVIFLVLVKRHATILLARVLWRWGHLLRRWRTATLDEHVTILQVGVIDDQILDDHLPRLLELARWRSSSLRVIRIRQWRILVVVIASRFVFMAFGIIIVSVVNFLTTCHLLQLSQLIERFEWLADWLTLLVTLGRRVFD